MRGNYTFIDLFAGAGGFSEGFLQASLDGRGFEFLLASDINENCELTHEVRYNEQLGLGIEFIRQDISRPDFVPQLLESLKGRSVDVVCGGPPCQSFSLAGRRRLHDKKDDLFSAYLRVIEALKPKYFVMENVAGMLTKDGGRHRQRVLDEINSILDIDHIGEVLAACRLLAGSGLNEGDAARVEFLHRRLRVHAGEITLAEYIREVERTYRAATVADLSYRISKTDSDVATIRHGLKMLRRIDAWAALRREVVLEKSRADIDNDRFEDPINAFLSATDADGVVDQMLSSIEALSSKHDVRLEGVEFALGLIGRTGGECLDTLTQIANSTPLAEVVSDIVEAARLYRIQQPLVLNARDFGVPQDRRRVVFVGCRRDQPFIGEIPATVSESDRVSVIEALWDLDFVEPGDAPADYRKFRAPRGAQVKRNIDGSLDTAGMSYSAWSRRGRLVSQNPDRRPYVRSTEAYSSREGWLYQNLQNHQASAHSEKVVQRLIQIQQAGGYNDDVRAHVASMGLESNKRNYSVLDPAGQSPTVMTIGDDYVHYREPRALTVREMARLQSFDDSFVFQGKRTTGGDRRKDEVPQYTLVGNAVPPLMARGIAMKLLEGLIGQSGNLGSVEVSYNLDGNSRAPTRSVQGECTVRA